MKIGIIGQGFVGNAIYQKFKNYYNVITYDLKPNLCNSTFEEVAKQLVIFVCLPTPMNMDGSCNIDLIEKTLLKISQSPSPNLFRTIVIKSTIPPGTTDKLNAKYDNLHIMFNPEFLTEANAIEDFNNQNRIILGGHKDVTSYLKTIYIKVFPQARIIKTDSTHAEMVKYLINTFLSTKVSFANEMYEISKSLGIDYDKVIEYATLDDRLGKSHWNVPGPDGDFGFGGHCFPKDLQALISLAHDLNVSPRILTAVDCKNNDVRKNKDWKQMRGRAVI
jgi:UDPglucose 6-dehydrogenase